MISAVAYLCLNPVSRSWKSRNCMDENESLIHLDFWV